MSSDPEGGPAHAARAGRRVSRERYYAPRPGSRRDNAAMLLALTLALASAAASPAQATSAPAPSLVIGRVVDATSGRPIAGAIVTLSGTAAAPDPGAAARPRLMTNAAGQFVVRGRKGSRPVIDERARVRSGVRGCRAAVMRGVPASGSRPGLRPAPAAPPRPRRPPRPPRPRPRPARSASRESDRCR